jgi:hypothetical protein
MTGQAGKRYARMKPTAATNVSQSGVEHREGGEAPPRFTPLDTSNYILSMVTELRTLAKASNFRFLTYLLEIAFQEAFRMTSELEHMHMAHGQKRKPPEPEPKV